MTHMPDLGVPSAVLVAAPEVFTLNVESHWGGVFLRLPAAVLESIGVRPGGSVVLEADGADGWRMRRRWP